MRFLPKYSGSKRRSTCRCAQGIGALSMLDQGTVHLEYLILLDSVRLVSCGTTRLREASGLLDRCLAAHRKRVAANQHHYYAYKERAVAEAVDSAIIFLCTSSIVPNKIASFNGASTHE